MLLAVDFPQVQLVYINNTVGSIAFCVKRTLFIAK